MSFPLFSRFGVEVEYMVVDRETLAVRPIVDALLAKAAALPGAEVETEEGGNPAYPNEVTLGDVSWSNELCLHVVELKTAEPARSLHGLEHAFAAHVGRVNEALAPLNAMLLPGGMHPTMDPLREMRLWPHDYSPVYHKFNEIFDCRGHGWANLQSCHLNLPFAEAEREDGEFARLHAAIRFLLPIMPALSASSPMMDGSVTGLLDNRLEVYRTNSRKIASATGKVIPEPVYTKAAYEREILERIYAEYAPHDPEGVLRDEWANSRGAIARFHRNTIEIRVLDVQECPSADLAIVRAITAAVRAIAEGKLGDLASIRRWNVEPLHAILMGVIRDADGAIVGDSAYLRELGMRSERATALDIWKHLVDRTAPEPTPALDVILSKGCLARRMMRGWGATPSPDRVAPTLRRLAQCLATNTPLD